MVLALKCIFLLWPGVRLWKGLLRDSGNTHLFSRFQKFIFRRSAPKHNAQWPSCLSSSGGTRAYTLHDTYSFFYFYFLLRKIIPRVSHKNHHLFKFSATVLFIFYCTFITGEGFSSSAFLTAALPSPLLRDDQPIYHSLETHSLHVFTSMRVDNKWTMLEIGTH